MFSEKNNIESTDKINRREFVSASMAAVSTASLALFSLNADAAPLAGSITVQSIIDLILKNIPNAPYQKTVDSIKAGSNDAVVRGVVTTMFPTIDVIQKAISLDANFIIVHEPTFYNHEDESAWLEGDDVYKYKKELLEKNEITIWRCHDYLHSRTLDGVQLGVLNALGMTKYYNSENPRVVNLPSIALRNLIYLFKTKLGIKNIRFIGNVDQLCQKIVLMPGAPDGKSQIKALREEQPDVLICGELREWETSEYVRDARAMGKKVSLVVLGHSVSEEPGMLWLKEWLQPKIGNIKVTHIPSQSPFTWM